MGFSVVLAAAGSGQRLGGVDKALLPIDGKTMLEHCLEVFSSCSEFTEVVVIGRLPLLDALRSISSRYPVPTQVVAGGATRFESIQQGLRAVDDDCRWVAIHDVARPLLSTTLINSLIRAVSKTGAVVPALALSDTIKEVAPTACCQIFKTLERDRLRRIQTPQVFDYRLLMSAYTKDWTRTEMESFTDDASVVEAFGHPVMYVTGESHNLKITTWEDVKIAEGLLSQTQPSSRGCGNGQRIGIGYDVHRFGGNPPLRIGGVDVSHREGLTGYSDGDVLLHALCDALLGAACLGDIGRHFPPGDPQYKGIDSRRLLERVAKKLRLEGSRVCSIDATVILEAPKLRPYIDAMRREIADRLSINVDRVSVKATTHEGMGSFGRGEGAGAMVVALISDREGP